MWVAPLLAAGADPDAKKIQGRTALTFALFAIAACVPVAIGGLGHAGWAAGKLVPVVAAWLNLAFVLLGVGASGFAWLYLGRVARTAKPRAAHPA